MVSSAVTSVEHFLASLPEDRRASIARVREVVNASLPHGYVEGPIYGMIGWYVPLSRLPNTYNGQPLCLVCVGAQKNYLVLHMMPVYGNKDIERAFRAGFKAAGKRLDMGKACVRFKTADALALDVVGETIARLSVDAYVSAYEASRVNRATGKKPGAEAKVKAKQAKAKPTKGKAKAKPAKGKAKAKAKPAKPVKAKR